jgi:hypothetical protein
MVLMTITPETESNFLRTVLLLDRRNGDPSSSRRRKMSVSLRPTSVLPRVDKRSSNLIFISISNLLRLCKISKMGSYRAVRAYIYERILKSTDWIRSIGPCPDAYLLVVGQPKIAAAHSIERIARSRCWHSPMRFFREVGTYRRG